ELRAGPARRAGGTLVYMEGAAVRLEGCRLRSPGAGPLIVLRQARALTVRGCRLEGGAVGLSAEVRPGGACRLALEDSVVEVAEPSGAALSLWSSEADEPGGARLSLGG